MKLARDLIPADYLSPIGDNPKAPSVFKNRFARRDKRLTLLFIAQWQPPYQRSMPKSGHSQF